MAGIYIHIPFCKIACHYCDFHFSTNRDSQPEMVDAIVREIALRADYAGDEPIHTIYFGGGTPSLLSASELNAIMTALSRHHQIDHAAEITLEANPDDLPADKLSMLRDAGINRLSVGIQSFDDDVLKFLNRAHDSDAARACVGQAREAGFDNISIDLIYALPGQSVKTWQENIDAALALKPNHISSYSLTIEARTVFGKWAATGRLKVVDDDLAAYQLEILMDVLSAAGYDQYEVSNFGLPGFWSRHNSSYWRQEKYIGLGPSAHSFNGLSRQHNIRNNARYVRAIQQGEVPAEIETLSTADKVNEFLLTTLRTSWGCDLDLIASQYGHRVLDSERVYIANLVSNDLAIMNGHTLLLTRRGKLLADKIASDLFIIAS